MRGTQRRLPTPKARTLNATRKVEEFALVWNSFARGRMATVKFEELMLARRVKRRIVVYVVSLAYLDQLRGSLGLVLGMGTVVGGSLCSSISTSWSDSFSIDSDMITASRSFVCNVVGVGGQQSLHKIAVERE